jgi:plastocyanin
VKVYTCYWKPPPVGGYEVKQDYDFATIPEPDTDGHITHMEVDMVDQNLDPIPISRLMLHHIVFLNISRYDKTCEGFAGFGEEQITGGGYAPQRFYAAGEERAKISFPPGYGYPLVNSHNWAMVYMLMNHRKTLDDQAWVQYKLTVDTSGSLEPVRPYWLDVNNCRADPIYNVPGMHPRARRKLANRTGPNATHTRSVDFTIQEDGWIVGGAGHVHGGARRLTITKPSCGNLQVAQSVPTWGLADHPFYNVKPILHEPGPIGMSAFRTARGIPVRAGQTIRLNSVYDNLRPHVRVMGIFIVYLAENQSPAVDGTPQECGGAPAGTQILPGTPPNTSGRPGPVAFRIPLTGIDADGNAITINGPPGPITGLRTGSTVTVGDRFFNIPNIRLRQGATLTYSFASAELHNLTLANGPLGIGSLNLNGARTYTQRFRRPGVYRFFCGLHPTQMTQRVIVRRKKHRRRR